MNGGDDNLISRFCFRTLSKRQRLLFSRAFQFHPREARVELKRHAERARKAGEPRAETLFHLLRLRLKAVRYRHVTADKIYKEEP